MKSVLNYIGQIRIYSLIDVIIFATALTVDTWYIFGIGLLWLSFLLYLEAQHKDHLRLKVTHLVWIICYLPTFFILPLAIPPLFGLFGIFYTLKKRSKFFGTTSPVWRGLQNSAISYFINPSLVFLTFFLIAMRNLVGDFRDAGDDIENKMTTIPIKLGLNKNQHWAFYAHMAFVAFTTYIWFQYSFLDKLLIIPIIIVQFLTYPLTPRSSNPSYLNIYKNK